MTSAAARFRTAYAAHRAAEGRSYTRAQLLALPYLTDGSLARQWSVRARSFDTLMHHVIEPATRRLGRAPRVLDLGAGNAWLCWRAARAGCEAVAVDVRDDAVDGLGAATPYVSEVGDALGRVAGSFDALPIADDTFDVVVFNASLHYALDLTDVLREARRVARHGARIAIVDTPFYARGGDGLAMIDEKRQHAAERFGADAETLMALPSIEYLTRERLTTASNGLALQWSRRRVRYPLWYEARPLVAWLRGARVPSRFDVWEAVVA
jgi:SAM-dependent methyltransferase